MIKDYIKKKSYSWQWARDNAPWLVKSYKGIFYLLNENLLLFYFVSALFWHILLETQTELSNLDRK